MSHERRNRLPAGVRDVPATDAGLRHEASHSFSIRGNVDQVFGVLDPVSEREWVDDWDPIPVFPEELSRAAGTVFKLVRDGRTAVWTVLKHSLQSHETEFLITEYEYQHRWIRVRCKAEDDDNTLVAVCYVTTALSADGQNDIMRYGEKFLRAWQEPIQAAINQMAA